MGLRNAPATFQSLIKSIFWDYIEEFIVINMDDVSFLRNAKEKHLYHLRSALMMLQKHDR